MTPISVRPVVTIKLSLDDVLINLEVGAGNWMHCIQAGEAKGDLNICQDPSPTRV